MFPAIVMPLYAFCMCADIFWRRWICWSLFITETDLWGEHEETLGVVGTVCTQLKCTGCIRLGKQRGWY